MLALAAILKSMLDPAGLGPFQHGNRPGSHLHSGRKDTAMSEAISEDQTDERPCLHCMMVELIDDFFAEYPTAGGEPDTVDTDEVLTAVAKTIAELTSTQNGTIRQQMIEQLMRNIMEYDAEFRQEDATGSAARH